MRQRRGPFWVAVVLASVVGCDRTSDSDEGPSQINLAIVGQALIEHDPRDYLKTPLATVTPNLARADAVFTNLEVAIAGPTCECEPTRTDVFFHGAQPDVLDYLRNLGVSLLALSNNHSWDYGTEGILSTITEARRRGFVHSGTGEDVSHASSPAYLEVGGVSLALVASASVNSPAEARATEDRAGVNMLEPGNQADWDRNLSSVRTANADVVVVYQHFQTDAEEGWQKAWAHAVIDAGADIYVSHGEPTLAGVEAYHGGLILYGLGNFIFHTKTELGRYPSDVWESVIAEVRLDKSGVREVTFTPIVLDPGSEGPRFLETRGYPEVATGSSGEAILTRLRDLSAAYGTILDLTETSAVLTLRE